MKKYSSYANLKIAPSGKGFPIEYWPKITNTPSTRKGTDIPLMVITKQPYAIPITTKYSAGYIQRQKMFSSKKQNKDLLNVKPNNTASNNNSNTNQGGNDSKMVQASRPNSSKNKRVEQKQRSSKKQKQRGVKIEKNLQIQNKQNVMYVGKPIRFDVQSPKGLPNYGNINLVSNKATQQKQREKQKSKSKLIQKQKQGQKVSRPATNYLGKPKQKKQKQKQEDNLNQYVTKYQPQQKSMLIHCTSDSNLLKNINLQDKKYIKGYYKSAVYNAFHSSKATSFYQICKNHLITSIQFLTYVKKNKQIIPNTVQKASLPNSNRKTIIFDLDETLIHCNQSLDMPHDVALEITFPNNSKIKAGINIRPYAVQCLKQLCKYFQIIVFTASHECYANVIVDYLDPNHEYISHRFFRQTCHKTEQGFYVKDLRVFGRDLSNFLLVDNAAYSYCFQPENGVPIVPFYNNKADLQLKQITSYLKEFIECKNMRAKNENYMRLNQYANYSCPKQLINQLYF